MYNSRTHNWPKIILGQLLVGFIMAAVGFYVLFVAQGYKLNLKNLKIIKTGILSISPYPRDSKIYLNGKLYRNKTIFNRAPFSQGLAPGYYSALVSKEGHQDWEATFRVGAEMVTRFPSVVLFKEKPLISSLRDQKKINTLYAPDEALAVSDSSSLEAYGSEIWSSGSLVTRFSSPISSASWYPDKQHILFQQGNEIRVIDKNGSNNKLLVALSTDIPVPFVVNNKGEEIYYFDNGEYFTAVIR